MLKTTIRYEKLVLEAEKGEIGSITLTGFNNAIAGNHKTDVHIPMRVGGAVEVQIDLSGKRKGASSLTYIVENGEIRFLGKKVPEELEGKTFKIKT